MAKRLENPNADDIGIAGVELTAEEFELILCNLEDSGADQQSIDNADVVGFIAGLQRSPATEAVFEGLKLPGDVRVVALYREGALAAIQTALKKLQHPPASE